MNKRIILYIILSLGIFISCTKDFEELNMDTKNPQEVTADVLFTNALIDLSDQISSTNVNDNIWKLMAQYWTERSYRDEANYDIVNRKISDGLFTTYYAILKNLNDAKAYVEAEKLVEPNLASKEQVRDNKLAIIDLLQVYVYQRLVDIFGDIPYSEALDSKNYTPKYDDAETIYKDLFARATASVNALDDTEDSFGTADLIYNGDVSAWFKFGNSLLLKMSVGVADSPLAALAKSTAETAAANVFTSASDGAFFPYQQALPYVNPLYMDLVASGRSDFVMVTGMVTLMTDDNDPRLDNYFADLDGITTDYGASGGSYGSKVHYNPSISKPDFHGILMTYNEIQFYLAEAAARNWTVGGTAEEFYNNGVTASIIEWGGDATEASTFLATKSYTSYTTWKEAIGTQAWVAMYTRGFIGYTFFRRLDYPALVMPPSPPTGVDVIPTRFTYPIAEQTLNKANYTAASTAVGGDLMTTKLFWDVN